MSTHEPEREPWARDLAALGELSKRELPSFSRTVDEVLASTNTPPPTLRERIMTKLKHKPLLIAAAAVLALAIMTPVAYAVVEKLFLTIDPSQPADEIEDGIAEQLEAQGIEASAVTVEKDGNATIVSIGSVDEHFPAELEIGVDGEHATAAEMQRIELDVADDLPADDLEALKEAVTTDEFLELTGAPAEGQSPDDRAAALEAFFAERGFPGTVATVTADGISVRVR